MRKRILLVIAAGAGAALALAVSAFASGPNVITNGDFQTGVLAPWTTFTTANGTINGGNVQSFNTTGNGASLAAHFQVGQVSYKAGVYEGGGISQTFSGVPLTLSADIAAHGGPYDNSGCGKFELLLDGATVDSHNFGFCSAGSTVRWHLSAVIHNGTLGTHQVAIRITRPYGTGSTPEQYVDNVVVTDRLAKT